MARPGEELGGTPRTLGIGPGPSSRRAPSTGEGAQREPAEEELYRAHFLSADARRMLVLLGISLVANLVFLPNDFRFVQDRSSLYALIGVRAAVTVGHIVAMVSALRAKSAKQLDRAQWIFFATYVLFLAYIPSTRPPGFAGYAVTSILSIVALYFALTGPAAPRITASLLISAANIWFVLRGTLPIAEKTSLVATHVLVQAIGFAVIGRAEQTRRNAFFSQLDERRVREELEVERDLAQATAKTRADFLALISHELRTPMHGVLGLSEVLSATPLTPEQRDLVRSIHGSAHSLFVVLSDILELANLEARNSAVARVPFILRDVIRSAFNIVHHEATAKGLTIELVLAEGVPTCLVGEELRLRQTLVHHLFNAVATVDRGPVIVRVSSKPTEGRQHEILFALDPPGAGFSVSAQEADPREVQASSPEEASVDNRLRLLVVDDNGLNHEVAAALLGTLGLSADSASSGQEALACVAKKEYDLIFMDIRMPDMDGIETARRIFANYADGQGPRIVALSATPFEEDRVASREVGMAEFLAKPLRIDDLRAALSRAKRRGPVSATDRPSLPQAPPATVAPSAARASAPATPAAPEKKTDSAPSAQEPVKAAQVAESPLKRAKLKEEAVALLRSLENPASPGFFAKVCERFIVDARTRIERMSKAAEDGKADIAEREAHTLKTASATVGAMEMSATCLTLEKAASRGDLSSYSSAVISLREELQAVTAALSEEAGKPLG